MFVSVFLLSESSDGVMVATGCGAEIRLPGLGEEEPAGWERQRGSRRRGDGKP